MDPLSEVFGSMRIQEAIYKRLERQLPGCSLLGDIGPRVRFMLWFAIGASEIQEFAPTFSLSAGDLSFHSQ